MTILITGGAGFIGSNFVMDWLKQSDEAIVNLDRLTYAGNENNLKSLLNDPRHLFVKGDIADSKLVMELLNQHHIRAVIHFAAESHVDRSIDSPEAFVQTNILGTFQLLEACRHYARPEHFRFIHVSTDEVYGSLAANDPAFTEQHPYQPNSPYSASKAASDHLVRAYFHTYGLPVITTHCSNNYGPYQYVEKLIPKMIRHAINEEALPIYGSGDQIRDWLYVGDHCAAIRRVLSDGKLGETYNIGGNCEKTNKELVKTLCHILDELKPRADQKSYYEQVQFVKDRPGHDMRYAINAGKIKRELGWEPSKQFGNALKKTVAWYLEQ